MDKQICGDLDNGAKIANISIGRREDSSSPVYRDACVLLRFAREKERERERCRERGRENTCTGGRSVRINSPCTRANMVHNLYETRERANKREKEKEELVKDRM